jgi:hypothetical protein
MTTPALPPELSEYLDRRIGDAMRQSRTVALDAAIQICLEAARKGESAATVVQMLRDFKRLVG